MKKFLTLLITSTALTATIGGLAWTALGASAGVGGRPFAAVFDQGKEALPLILASDDDHDDDREYRRSSRRHHDDHDDHDDDDDGDDDRDDDDDDRRDRGARNPAPAGIVTPPSNGLFGKGTPPKVQVN